MTYANNLYISFYNADLDIVSYYSHFLLTNRPGTIHYSTCVGKFVIRDNIRYGLKGRGGGVGNF